ncbi:MAG: hypothetical protein R3E84_03395 [Pseudomonadales bacterium]
MPLERIEIHRLLDSLNAELRKTNVRGEIYLVGGAVMCLVYEARQSTQDLDAFFQPASAIRTAADRVAAREGYPSRWLNDAVKGYLSDRGDFSPYLELSHLTVMTANAEYLLAMKCLAMRLGAEFRMKRIFNSCFAISISTPMRPPWKSSAGTTRRNVSAEDAVRAGGDAGDVTRETARIRNTTPKPSAERPGHTIDTLAPAVTRVACSDRSR